MSERRLRLVLAGVTFVTFFLPWDAPPVSIHNWALIFVYLQYLPGLLYGLAIPLLFLSNTCLLLSPSANLRLLYRIFLLPSLLFATWHLSVSAESRWRGVGFWTNIAVVSVAALLEIVFVIKERVRKLEGCSGRLLT